MKETENKATDFSITNLEKVYYIGRKNTELWQVKKIYSIPKHNCEQLFVKLKFRHFQ